MDSLEPLEGKACLDIFGNIILSGLQNPWLSSWGEAEDSSERGCCQSSHYSQPGRRRREGNLSFNQMEESTSKDFAEPVIPPGSQELPNGTQAGFCVRCSPTPHPSPRDGERTRQERPRSCPVASCMTWMSNLASLGCSFHGFNMGLLLSFTGLW